MKRRTGNDAANPTDILGGGVFMWTCKDCQNSFAFPEIKRPDAGLVMGKGILGGTELKPIRFCPECLSIRIKKKEGEGND